MINNNSNDYVSHAIKEKPQLSMEVHVSNNSTLEAKEEETCI